MARVTTALVTGFEPFAQDALNPSGLVAETLDGRSIEGADIRGLVLPVDSGRVEGLLGRAIGYLAPRVVIGLGYAAGRMCINIERVALNVMDFAIPDAAGNRPIGAKIVPDAPDSYLSTLPLLAMEERLRAEGIPCTISNTAGTYVCNQVMYLLAHRVAGTAPECTVGFIHLPALPTMDRALAGRIPSMSLELMTHAVELAVGVALANLKRNQTSEVMY